jgi:hypothetical protein
MKKWLPIAPKGMPSVWAQCQNYLPTRAGAYYPANFFTTPSNFGGAVVATAGAALRAWCALYPSESVVAFVGTTTKLLELSVASGYADCSRGGGYTNTAQNWSFAQFGNVTIACNRIDATQVRIATAFGSVFADLAGAPKARIAVTQQMQVLLFDLNDGAEKPDYFIACKPGDYTDWASASATGPNPIWQTPGRITAAVAYRDYVLVFKKSAVYRLTYTGTTYKWKVELVAPGIGAWGMHDVVNCGDTVVFCGPGGAWRFDGASFRSISDYFGEIPSTSSGDSATAGSFFCPASQNVVFDVKFVANGRPDGTTNRLYAYNLISDRWGGAMTTTSAGTDFWPDTLGNTVALTGEAAALRVFMSALAVGGTLLGGKAQQDWPDLMVMINPQISPINSSVLVNTVYWGGGQATSSAFLMGAVEGIGGTTITDFKRLNLDTTVSGSTSSTRTVPTAAEFSLTSTYGDIKDSVTANAGPSVTSSTNQRRFDLLFSAVYAQFKVSQTGTGGYIEINDYDVEIAPAGSL